ncbi:hypothetical protein OG752_18670 [Streptomyces anulatus]
MAKAPCVVEVSNPETGLHDNYFRHYDPETARYLTPDPLGLVPAPNPATYVKNPTPRPPPSDSHLSGARTRRCRSTANRRTIR